MAGVKNPEWIDPGQIDNNGGLISNDQAAAVDQGVAAGTLVGGSYQYNSAPARQNSEVSSESNAERDAERQNDYQYGVNNSDQANADIAAAQGIGTNYGNQQQNLAGNDQGAALNAQNRGTGAYMGDTSAYNSAQAYANNDRGMQTGAYGQLMNFANQGPGPSAAQAQLQQSTNANTSNALALARSGTGMGGSAAGMRQAIAQNAVTQQTANAQSAELRANENTAYQAQKLSALGQAGGVASQTVAGDQATAASGLAGAQYQSNTTLQGQQLNDQTGLGYSNAQEAALGGGYNAEMGAQGQVFNVNNSALNAREGYEGDLTSEHGITSGANTQTSIADANRTEQYIGTGLQVAGTVAAVASDVRAKSNIVPLSSRVGQSLSRAGQGLGGSMGDQSSFFSYLAKRNKTDKELNNPTIIRANPYGQDSGNSTIARVDPYTQLVSKYGGSAPSASDASQVDAYAKASPQKLDRGFNSMTDTPPGDGTGSYAGAFSRSDHPILSAGDSLLADSARATPGSLYAYKDPKDGAGTYVGPMAQDMAKDPLAKTAVGQDPSGKLHLDVGRLSTLNTAQNHAQQNQLDDLDARINSLSSLLKGSSAYADPSAPNTDDLDDADQRRYQQAAGY